MANRSSKPVKPLNSTSTSGRQISADAGFAELVRQARVGASMSQAELARKASVSPKTIVNLEETGIARFDAVVRVADALGQPADQWVKLAGHSSVTLGRIEDVRRQKPAERRATASTFTGLSQAEYFRRTAERLAAHKLALRCVMVMSPVKVDTPGLTEHIEGMLRQEGMHMAILSPFPFLEDTVSERLPSLSLFYRRAYEWAVQGARMFRAKVPAARSRIHMFRLQGAKDGGMLVYPPLRLAEYRPILTKYVGDKGSELYEFGAYLHFLDGTSDQWIDIYSGSGAPNEQHAGETFAAWNDFFREIVEAWDPGNKEGKPFKEGLVFWKRVPVDGV